MAFSHLFNSANASLNTEQTSDLQNEHIDSTDKSSVASGDIVKK
jgi:hypothetical protein